MLLDVIIRLARGDGGEEYARMNVADYRRLAGTVIACGWKVRKDPRRSRLEIGARSTATRTLKDHDMEDIIAAVRRLPDRVFMLNCLARPLGPSSLCSSSPRALSRPR